MSPLKEVVEALGREINRLYAKQHPPDTLPLVPLPSEDNHEEGGGGVSRGCGNVANIQDREEPVGEGCDQEMA